MLIIECYRDQILDACFKLELTYYLTDLLKRIYSVSQYLVKFASAAMILVKNMNWKQLIEEQIMYC